MDNGNPLQFNQDVKKCRQCKKEKSFDSFHKSKKRACGLHDQCKDCRKLYYTSEHAKKLGRASDKRRTGTSKRLSSNNKATKKYKQTERGKKVCIKYESSNKGKIKNKRYRNSDRGKYIFQNISRRRRELENRFVLLLDYNDIKKIKDSFDNKCFKCESQKKLEIDHHYPLFLGFSLSLGNAVLLCKSCNSLKGYKMPEEFYTSDELVRLLEILCHNAIEETS